MAKLRERLVDAAFGRTPDMSEELVPLVSSLAQQERSSLLDKSDINRIDGPNDDFDTLVAKYHRARSF